MISQISSATNTPVQTGQQSAPVVELKQQKQAAPVELPKQSVKAIEKPDAASVKQAAETINKFMQQFNRNVQFTVDEDTGSNVVKVIDGSTKDVIRQMPSEEMLAIARALDKLQGLLIKEKA